MCDSDKGKKRRPAMPDPESFFLKLLTWAAEEKIGQRPSNNADAERRTSNDPSNG